jgi:WhiB family transcriptional regulator, redox-sensing transcriptional regulator
VHELACSRRLQPLDPELFFPVSTSGASLTAIEAAKRVCQRCPVTTPCLSWALDLGHVSGIWAALQRKNGAPCSAHLCCADWLSRPRRGRTQLKRSDRRKKEGNSHGRSWRRVRRGG